MILNEKYTKAQHMKNAIANTENEIKSLSL